MTTAVGRGPVVIDTDVYDADLVPGSRLAAVYEPIIVGRPAFISFQTAAELRYGALRRSWGAARMRSLEARIDRAETVHSGPELVLEYAQLRAECERIGHALGQRDHDADRWIATTRARASTATTVPTEPLCRPGVAALVCSRTRSPAA